MNFGDDLRLREDAREMWGSTWLDRLHQDLTYGARVLRNAPAFTLTAMLVLVLGIGVPLSAFRVMLTDLQGGSVPDPDSLVRLTRRAPDAHVTSLTYPELTFYAANARSFRNVIGVSTRNPATFGEAADGSTPDHAHRSHSSAATPVASEPRSQRSPSGLRASGDTRLIGNVKRSPNLHWSPHEPREEEGNRSGDEAQKRAHFRLG